MTASPPRTRAVVYPEDLPVSARREDIMRAITDHQVVVIAGETGSGKTTQIPKMCLELGLGERGLIGHTQPRRLAARSVAERIAAELGEKVGATVGYQVRFTSEVGQDSRIKLMTDGILLAEIQHDRLLRRYSAIIIDEAHERSLNIDFLLGYLRRILPRRPDLKVIITSATIDPERFARHFAPGAPDPVGPAERPGTPEEPGGEPEPAPVIEVSGRTYPVEIRWRPLSEPRSGDGGADAEDAGDGLEDEDRDPIDAVCDAVEELSREAPGDILVFFAGEREIRDAQEALQGALKRIPRMAEAEILPLFGRLSMAEQHRVFAPSGRRRIVLATNVAETSLTVPGIKYVIDPGTARISRYSARTKVQRLPIERISRASADQRAGRCGRVSDGICIRLYSEEDYLSRPEFTDPEILRTNLAAVILQMTSVGVVNEPGDIERFPFVEPPESRAVKDGVALLRELGALDDPRAGAPGRPRRGAGDDDARRGPLTAVGRQLAQLPVDPRLGRMIVEADRRGCAREVMVLAAALTVQDPRERPLEKRQQADEAHKRFVDENSDFTSFLLLWRYVQEQQEELSSTRFRKLCQREHLNFLRIREWQDLYAQLRQMGQQAGIRVGKGREVDPVGKEREIHVSLLSGLLSHIGLKDERRREYQGARGTRFAIFPGSNLFKRSPDWVMSAELVETSRLWARVNAVIDPLWAEELAPGLIKRSVSEPHWSRAQGSVLAWEKVTLYGVPIVARRRIQYWRVDPAGARELFLRHALVEGDWQTRHRFFARNRARLAEVEELENRLRRKDLRIDDEALFAFYDQRVPESVVSARHFDAWWRKARSKDEHLLDLDPEQLIAEDARDYDESLYPRQWVQRTRDGELVLDLDYEFAPGAEQADGVTVRVPVLFLNQLDPEPFRWHVPGLRAELVTALIRSLPKAVRRHFVPAPDVARRAVEALAADFDPATDALEPSLELVLRRMQGHVVPPGSWDWEAVPAHLRVRFQVRDRRNRVLGEGEDLEALRAGLRDEIRAALAESLGAVPAGPAGPAGTRAGRTRPPGRKDPSGRAAAAPRAPEQAPPALERSGLTAWPEQDLPRTVESTVAGQRITGYPALVPEEAAAGGAPTVAVRILSSAAEQHAAQRRGTIALLQRSLPSPERYVLEHLNNQEKLVFAQNPHGSVTELIADCTVAAIDKLVPPDPPFTRTEYDRVHEHVRAELIDTVFQVTAVVEQVLSGAARVRRTLKRSASLAAVNSLNDVKAQLEHLVHPGFVAATGWAQLQHLPRYVRAMEVRLEKLGGHLQRDTANLLLVQKLEDDYDAALTRLPPAAPVPEQLRRVGWLIEELRVSLFAQELGTARTVSEKRVRRALREALDAARA
ncbi:ATP-dependent RNA helicase HrpA [Kocuria flava]|uniref:ATP-dependent RNA helicase HrpA n=1 Tax=Kocuria flava TaxID=446860 RepID=A0A0U3GK11_9MICC|nr:ATP-dependent RNA helicase HrpA [Kocuria flava]ALU40494.1 ATP-dependent RNA helicase HrpA [Kocuria flava]GEO92921.1 ATP-dependent helicase [Kocuria flava]